MSKIFRISGYLVDKQDTERVKLIELFLRGSCADGGFLGLSELWQQLHIEEGEQFELDGEDKENCDLALLTRHFTKDNSNMQFDRPLPEQGQNYKHFKLGKIVTVIGISRHTETEEVTVVYDYEGTIWNRPLEMFMSEVDHEKYPEEKQKYRFELVMEGDKNEI